VRRGGNTSGVSRRHGRVVKREALKGEKRTRNTPDFQMKNASINAFEKERTTQKGRGKKREDLPYNSGYCQRGKKRGEGFFA